MQPVSLIPTTLFLVKDIAERLEHKQNPETKLLSEKKTCLNRTSGLICYIQGYFAEIGFNQTPDPIMALQYYIYGVLMFLDPLCAHKIYTLTQDKKFCKFNKLKVTSQLKETCQIISTSLCFLQYGINSKDSEKAYKFTEIQDTLKNFNQGILEMSRINFQVPNDSPAKEAGELLLNLLSFNQNLNKQIIYDDILKCLSKYNKSSVEMQTIAYNILLHLLSIETLHQTKNLKQLIHIIKSYKTDIHNNLSSQQCADFCIMSSLQESNNIFTHQITTFFELIFVQQILNRKEIHQNLELSSKILYSCSNMNQNIQQKVLIIRLFAKYVSKESIEKSFEIQKEEIIYESLLGYYYLGKLQNKLLGQCVTSECYLCKCDKMIDSVLESNEDIYKQLVYRYFQGKIELAHIGHSNKKINDVYINQIGELYDVNVQLFDFVKTFQFFKLRSKIDKLRVKLKKKNDKLALIIQEGIQLKQLNLANKQSKFNNSQLQLSQQQLTPKSRVSLAPKIGPQLNSILGVDNCITGSSQILSFLADEHPLQVFTNMDPLQQQFQNQLLFFELNDIESIFIRKGNRAGELYAVIIKGQGLTMKQFPFVLASELMDFFNSQIKFEKLNHSNLRKIYAYSIQDFTKDTQLRQTATVSLIYDRYTCNLQEYLQINGVTLKQKVNIMVKITDCVVYLHNDGVMFCNLKPSNILMSLNEPFVTDWDIQDIEKDLECCYAYTSPEKFHNKNNIDHSDTWSLGMIYLFIIYNIIHVKPKEEKHLTTTLQLSQLKGVNLYSIESLKLDFSELKEKNNQNEINILEKLRLLVEGMVIKDPQARMNLSDVLLILFDLFDQL